MKTNRGKIVSKKFVEKREKENTWLLIKGQKIEITDLKDQVCNLRESLHFANKEKKEISEQLEKAKDHQVVLRQSISQLQNKITTLKAFNQDICNMIMDKLT